MSDRFGRPTIEDIIASAANWNTPANTLKSDTSSDLRAILSQVLPEEAFILPSQENLASAIQAVKDGTSTQANKILPFPAGWRNGPLSSNEYCFFWATEQ